jgi:hypothetical protein
MRSEEVRKDYRREETKGGEKRDDQGRGLEGEE